MTDDITPLPCPFCGCAMSLSAVARDWWRVTGDHSDDCILLGQRADAPQTDDQKQLLIGAWNRRAAVEADRAAQIHDNASCISKLAKSDKQDQSGGVTEMVEDHVEGVRHMVPSDEIDIADVRQYLDQWGCLAHPGVRALIDRYSSGRPAASAEPASAVNRETVIEWLDALDIEVTDKQLDGLFHAALFTAPVAQEPVAWRYLTPTGWHATTDASRALGIKAHHDVEPLYAAPVVAQAQPLTTGQILSLERRSSMTDDEAIRFARSVQSALSGQPSAQDRDDAPSIWNQLTPYGVLVRALRLVSGTTLMEMSDGTGYTPAYLSGIEFGRIPVTDGVIGAAFGFFCDKGIDVPLSLLQAARAAKGE